MWSVGLPQATCVHWHPTFLLAGATHRSGSRHRSQIKAYTRSTHKYASLDECPENALHTAVHSLCLLCLASLLWLAIRRTALPSNNYKQYTDTKWLAGWLPEQVCVHPDHHPFCVSGLHASSRVVPPCGPIYLGVAPRLPTFFSEAKSTFCCVTVRSAR